MLSAAMWPTGKMSVQAATGAPVGSAWAVAASARTRTAAVKSFMTWLGVW